MNITWRERLACSAGFFDGEGHTRCDPHRGSTTTLQPRISITQYHREPLDRFLAAVGVGKVYGPYKGRAWSYTVIEYEKVQAVVAMMWQWLGSVKRAQAKAALAAALASKRNAPGRPADRPTCKYGHVFSGVNLLSGTRNGYQLRRCRTCNRERSAHTRARKKFAVALLTA